MKKILIKTGTILIAFIATASIAFADNNTKELNIDGIKVILKTTPKEVISVRMFVEGGTANYDDKQQGIENLTLNLMMDGGTKNLSKLDFKTELEKIGTSFSASTNLDYGFVSMTCIRAFWEKSWNLFTDAVMHPALSQEEFTLLQQQLVANAKSSESDPDGHLSLISRRNAFPNSNYRKEPNGTAESLNALTLEQAQKYYAQVIVKKRIFLVVVGNISEAEITKAVKESLVNLPQGNTTTREQQTILTEGKIFIEDRDIATNYIRGIMSAPMLNSEDGVAMRIAMSILYDRFFTELRTKRSLSYAPAAFYAQAAVFNPYSVVYISTTDPAQSMQVMVDEINKIKKEGFTEEELVNTRETFLTQYYLTLETTANQANALGVSEMAGGWEMMDNFTKLVNETTLKEVNKVFDQYSKAIVWTYLGKKDMVKQQDFKQPIETINKPY